jgi:hypothetical protein
LTTSEELSEGAREGSKPTRLALDSGLEQIHEIKRIRAAKNDAIDA